MKFIMCPRCELNYIPETEKYCKICLRELKGEAPKDEVELCSVCNEAPALPGKDVCLFCLREMNNAVGRPVDTDDADPSVDADSLGDMESMSEMEEMLPEVDEENNEELGEMGKELSLEAVQEDEAMEDESIDQEPEEI